MPKTNKRQLTIPALSRKGFRLMQEGACSDEADCKGDPCIKCIYYEHNLDHFINYFDLEDRPGTLGVIEIIKEEDCSEQNNTNGQEVP
ncbi:hypothetical protein KAR91_30455 [Candidatus Pacearchaeota archaeon]|nr:hypothetical protein [Candidatus Pacearchaeota archaeon]